MDSLRRFIYLAVIFGILANKAYCKPSSDFDKDKDYDYANDDNYPNDDEDSNDDEGDDKGPPPVIETKSQTLTVMEGHDIFLPCEVRNGERFTVMWRTGKNFTTVMFLGDRKMSNDPRLYKFPNNTLWLRHALVSDSGEYACQVSSEPVIQITHVLNVIIPPSIARVVPEIPPGQSKYVNKGESLTLACEARGHPEPKVTWTKRGHNKHFPDGKDKMEGTSITFEEVDRKYSGIYECEASNAYGTVKKSFEIHVHYPPEIEIEEETVTTALGLEPEITCTVHAEPKATVSWLKNGKQINNSNRISTSVVGNKHTLQITGLSPEDFGSYTCHANNRLGTDHKAIILSGSPTRPKVKIGVSGDGKSPEVTWTVESYSAIEAYDFQYKKSGEREWVKLQPQVHKPEEGNIYSGKEILRELSPAEYLIRIRARNNHGWSQFSSEETFSGEAAAESKTGGAEDLRPATVLLLFIMYTISRIFI